MKISLNWLSEFVDFKKDAWGKISTLLNNRTMEVEKIIDYSRKLSFKNIVVGEIKSLSNHPSNDNFGIAEIYAGKELGAKRVVFTKKGLTVSVGDRPLVATKGAIFENGLKIRDKAIFGVVSEAAFCSEKDLGIDLNIESIVKFPWEEPGRTAYDIFDFDDSVLEFDLEPNRPDLFGITGFGHELSAILGRDLKKLELYEGIEIKEGKSHSEGPSEIKIDVENKDVVPSYILAKINNIEIRESVPEIRNRLIKSGIRPVNNIVDITNIVMLETSQPLHAFDAEKIGKSLSVRLSRKDEVTVTLDGKERKLGGGEILIESNGSIIAIAGIMGGIDSGIKESTVSIAVESANFNMFNIRRTSRTLSLRSEASTRFEKGLQPIQSVLGMKRFLYLLKKYIPGAEIEYLSYDIEKFKNPPGFKLKFKDLNEFLGEDIDNKKVEEILSRLGYSISLDGKDSGELTAVSPVFRSDIRDKVDVYEDIFRIYGYENISSTYPCASLAPPAKNMNYETGKVFRNLLAHLGFIEVINPSLVGKKEIEMAGIPENEILELKNPISIDYSYFRTSLIPGILRGLSQNTKKYKNIKIYEIGKTYRNIKAGDLPVSEENYVCGLLSGGIKLNSPDTEFYHGKSIVEFILKESGIKRYSLVKLDGNDIFDETSSLEVYVGKDRIGIFGEIKSKILEDLKIDFKAFVYEINLDAAGRLMTSKKTFIPPAKYPGVEQDISIIANREIEYEKIEKFIKNFSRLVKNVRLEDVYSGKQIKEGSISFLIRYDALSETGTLTMEEVNLLRDDLIKKLNEKFGVILRT